MCTKLFEIQFRKLGDMYLFCSQLYVFVHYTNAIFDYIYVGIRVQALRYD